MSLLGDARLKWVKVSILKYGKLNQVAYKTSYMPLGQMHWYFCWKNVSSFCKSYSHFWGKNINAFENTLGTTLNEFVINHLVKLMML